MKTLFMLLASLLVVFPVLAQNEPELVCDAFPTSPTEQRVGYYMGEGAGFLGSGEYSRAIDSFSCVIEQVDPDFVGAYIQRARAYTARHVYERAIEDYTAALDREPNLIGVYNNRGVVYAAQREFELARQDFDQTLALDPNYVLGYTNRAVIATLQGDYEAALADLDQALALSDIDDAVTALRDPNRLPDAPRSEFDTNHARIYALIGIVRSAQALENYDDYLLLMGSQADSRIQAAAGSLESRFAFDLRLDDGTWLLVVAFTQAGEEILP